MPETRTSQIIESFVVVVASLIYFLWGYNYHFHTSELWSIHIANEFFNETFKDTIWIKPLFHFLLKIPFFFPLSDSSHLMLVKSVFALNGSAQIFLSFLIFKNCTKEFKLSNYYSIFGILLLAINPFYLNYAFRIRSDLIATTLFLLYIYLRVCKRSFSIKYDIAFVFLFPLIGIKHVLYSIVVLSISITSGRKLQFTYSKHYVFALAFVTALVWILTLGWNSATYYFSTLQSYYQNLNYFYLWLKNDILLLVIGLLPLLGSFFKDSEITAHHKPITFSLRFLHIAALVYFALISQKYSFFIASLIPIFFLSSFLGILIIIEKISLDLLAKSIVFSIGLCYLVLSIFNSKNYFPYHSNLDQLKFISRVGPVLHEKNLSILDGVGIFPRVSNWKCFYSPDDPSSINYCRNLISNAKPPVIILTGRLLNIVSGDAELESYGYLNIGAGIFVLKNQKNLETLNFQLAPSAGVTFGLEQ